MFARQYPVTRPHDLTKLLHPLIGVYSQRLSGQGSVFGVAKVILSEVILEVVKVVALVQVTL